MPTPDPTRPQSAISKFKGPAMASRSATLGRLLAVGELVTRVAVVGEESSGRRAAVTVLVRQAVGCS